MQGWADGLPAEAQFILLSLFINLYFSILATVNLILPTPLFLLKNTGSVIATLVVSGRVRLKTIETKMSGAFTEEPQTFPRMVEVFSKLLSEGLTSVFGENSVDWKF